MNIDTDDVAALRDKLILVRLSMSQWSARKYDRTASKEVAENHGVADHHKAGRFNKVLLDLTAVKPIGSAFRELKHRHERLTSVWNDDGVRVLPAALFFDYKTQIREAREAAERAVEDFIQNEYEAHVKRARATLKTLFRESDYPSPDELRRRYGVRVSFQPLPNPEDCKAWGLGDLAARETQRQLVDDIREQIDAAHQRVIERVQERVHKFVEAVRRVDEEVPEGERAHALRTSTVEKFRELVDVVLNGLNITDDPKLTDMAKELADALDGVDRDKLSNSESLRRKTTRQVESIAKKFAGAFGPVASAGGAQ